MAGKRRRSAPGWSPDDSPQRSPAVMAGKSPDPLVQAADQIPAATEPGRDGREEVCSAREARSACSGRNGARP